MTYQVNLHFNCITYENMDGDVISKRYYGSSNVFACICIIYLELAFGIPYSHNDNLFCVQVNTVDQGKIFDEKLTIAFTGIYAVFSWGAPMGSSSKLKTALIYAKYKEVSGA